MTANVEWTYSGEIIDPEQSPITAAVYTCEICGALVAGMGGRSVHEAWHNNPWHQDRRA